jgi:predicted ArsR family transcriptional regulator
MSTENKFKESLANLEQSLLADIEATPSDMSTEDAVDSFIEDLEKTAEAPEEAPEAPATLADIANLQKVAGDVIGEAMRAVVEAYGVEAIEKLASERPDLVKQALVTALIGPEPVEEPLSESMDSGLFMEYLAYKGGK